MRTVIGILLASASLGFGSHAYAEDYTFDFRSNSVNGSIRLTYASNPNTGVLGTSPNMFDPVGSYIVTGATGNLFNSTLGLNTTVTGVVPSNPANPHTTNLLAPASFGHFLVAAGVPGPGGVAPGFSYDNLFYPGGSPPAATDYPFGGGFLDIYGLVFTTTDDVFINFWSNGDPAGIGRVSYGAGFTDSLTVLDYVNDIDVTSVPAVPEPATWAMLLLGFGAVGAMARRRRSRTTISFA